jgi:lysophospholipase L1-like esterase
MFLGDQTSPDNPGYVAVISEVLARFHPELGLNIISAGSPGQTAGGLQSRALLDLLISSHPDWLVINIGLADALREPQLGGLLARYGAFMATAEAKQEDDTLGPEHRIRQSFLGPHSDSGTLPSIEWTRLPSFQSHVTTALQQLRAAGISSIVMTTVAVGNDLQHPLNLVMRSYNRVLREVASHAAIPLIDVDRAFRSVLERAINYRQRVALANHVGEANPQGQALIARTFLNTFGLLPQSGLRPPR